MNYCKYPESVCPHMMLFQGKTHCSGSPCQLTGELPDRTNADWLRGMNDEELAHFISIQFFHGYGEPKILEWLKRPVED